MRGGVGGGGGGGLNQKVNRGRIVSIWQITKSVCLLNVTVTLLKSPIFSAFTALPTF